MATASRVLRLSANSTILIEASWLKLFGASLIPNILLSALVDAELSLDAVSGNTDALEVYTGFTPLAYKKNSAANNKPPARIRNLKRPIFKNIAFISSLVVTNMNFYFTYLKMIPVSITGIEATITDFTRSDIAAPSGL